MDKKLVVLVVVVTRYAQDGFQRSLPWYDF